MFKNLRVVGLGATASYQPTLGSALNLFNILKGMLSRRPPPIRDLLSGFEGVVQPGQMLCTFFIFYVVLHVLVTDIFNIKWCWAGLDRAAVPS